MNQGNAVVRKKGFQTLDVVSRFWRSVDKDGPLPENMSLGPCWLWTASTDGNGYGNIYYNGKRKKATHVAWFIENGYFPPPGVLACHHCDNPNCVRPSHLFLGTHKDNTRDAVSKGRMIMPEGFGLRHNSLKTHCPNGHPYDSENTVWSKDHKKRACRICQRAHRKSYNLRKLEALQPAQKDPQ